MYDMSLFFFFTQTPSRTFFQRWQNSTMDVLTEGGRFQRKAQVWRHSALRSEFNLSSKLWQCVISWLVYVPGGLFHFCSNSNLATRVRGIQKCQNLRLGDKLPWDVLPWVMFCPETYCPETFCPDQLGDVLPWLLGWRFALETFCPDRFCRDYFLLTGYIAADAADALLLLMRWCCECADAADALLLLKCCCCECADAADGLLLLMHWCCWCADNADASDAADVLMLLMCWCCWCTDAADALMLLLRWCY